MYNAKIKKIIIENRSIIFISVFILGLILIFVFKKETPNDNLNKVLNDYKSSVDYPGYTIIKGGEIYKDEKGNVPDGWAYGDKNILVKYTKEYSKLNKNNYYIIINDDSSLPLETIEGIDTLENAKFIVACEKKKIKNVFPVPTPYTGELETKITYDLPNIPFGDKINKCIWRGMSNSIDGECNKGVRRTIIDILKNRTDIADVGFNRNHIKNLDLPMKETMNKEEQCKFKIILSIDGWGWPGSIHWSFYSGSIPLIVSEYRPDYLKFFEEGKHYYSAKLDGSDIIDKINYILNKSDKDNEIMIDNITKRSNEIFNPEFLRNEYKKNFINDK